MIIESMNLLFDNRLYYSCINIHSEDLTLET